MVVPNQFPQANFSETSFQSFYKNYASFFHLMQAVITMIQFISERASSSGKTLQNVVECLGNGIQRTYKRLPIQTFREIFFKR